MSLSAPKPTGRAEQAGSRRAPEIGIGMAGYGFMGRAHAHGWRTVAHVFDLPLHPRLVAVAGRDGAAAKAAAGKLGFSTGLEGWDALIARDDIGLIDVCTPGSGHADVAIAALEAGKHVLCEKPLANSVAESEAMAAAAERAAANDVVAMVAFNYRRVPAVEVARRLVAENRLGTVRHVRAVYLQDWGADPETPLLWRFVAEQAGTGALGDLGAHVVDLAQHIAEDDVASVSALLETFVKERPLTDGSGARGRVTVDDAAVVTARFAGGATGAFEVTRLAPGRKNALRIEVNGEVGSLAWDLERPNELALMLPGEADAREGFRRVLVTEPGDPWLEAWWPPGHVLGWDATFVHELRDLLQGVSAGAQVAPTFADGLQVDRVLGAIADSAASGRWAEVTPRNQEVRA
jgi:predicted dehydrogenase